MSDSLNAPLLVTGAGGHLGRRVVELLLEKGAGDLAAGSRDPAKLGDLAAAGAKTVKVDFDDPAALDAAFAGVERLLIVSTDALGEPGRRQKQHKAAVDAAAKVGVKHIVYTSMPNPEPGSLIPFAPDHYATEQAVEASGVPFTILRVNWYMENLLGSLPQAIASGQLFSAAGDGRVGHVARGDVARAAAAALIAGPDGARLDVTGPEALSPADIAGIAAEVAGRPVEVVAVSDAQLAEGLEKAGLPAPIAALLAAFDANTRAGKADVVSAVVETLTGEPPLSLRAFLEANRGVLIGA